jgi:ribonuclease HII
MVRQIHPVAAGLSIEKKIRQSGIRHIAGIDEVGRGSVAGPVMACAVIFRPDYFQAEVRDSKVLNRRKRQELREVLCREALSWSVGLATVREIDYFNIRIATFIAMRRALAALRVKPDITLVDGEALKNTPYASLGVIKGDSKSFSISAASIIAKETRDLFMEELDRKYPGYLWYKNKGYGTNEHLLAIYEKGITICHRKTFLKNIDIFGINLKTGH